MTPSARFALAIALTNVPQGTDWKLVERLAKIFAKGCNKKEARRLLNTVKQNEVYNIPDILNIISIDKNEYNHLMCCLYQNGLAGSNQGNESDGEIHEKEEYWEMDEMETKGLEKICVSEI